MESTEQLAARPHFIISARVAVPAGLAALPPQTEVTFATSLAGYDGMGAARADLVIEQLEAEASAQAQGMFSVPAAAQILAESQSLESTAVLEAMQRAVRAGELRLVAGDVLMVRSTPPTGHAPWWGDFVRAQEIDEWLADTRASYRFPAGLIAAPRVPMPKAAKAGRRSLAPSGKATTTPSTQRAANARWAHLDAFKAKALEIAKSKTFASYAAAAREAALQLDPKPKPKSRPDSEDTYYPPGKIEDWLKEAGWTPAASDE